MSGSSAAIASLVHVPKAFTLIYEVCTSMDTVESWDSLSQMNLVLALEDEFGIEIPDLEIQNMISVNLIVLLVQELLDQ